MGWKNVLRASWKLRLFSGVLLEPWGVERTTWGQSEVEGCPFRPFPPPCLFPPLCCRQVI